MGSRLPFLGGAALTYVGATYGFYVFNRPAPSDLSEDECRGVHDRDVTSCTYDNIAASYDRSMAWEEWITGITAMRKAMMAQAHGDVLEVSVGTGRNFEYYTDKVQALTGVDISPGMVEVAREKLRQEPATTGGGLHPGRVRLEVADAVTGIAGGRYDFVVDTFGLCSCSAPVQLLKAMGEACKPGTGRVLLLEHGRSREWGWLSSYLDRNAPRHARNWGCWFNRDVLQLVKEAGLIVEEVHMHHLGTTYRIVCSKKVD